MADTKRDVPIKESKGAKKSVNDWSIHDIDKERSDEEDIELLVRVVLWHAGYDVSKIRDFKHLDKKARDVYDAKTTRKRLVFCRWPRHPKGKPISPDSSLPGKTTSNGVQLWGASLFDFYYVHRLPHVKGLMTISTGSKLAAWMKANGELDYAAPEIASAEAEENPKEVPPCDVACLVEDIDFRLSAGIQGHSMPPAMAEAAQIAREERAGKEKGKEKMSSVFDTSTYPSPWPLVPFTYLAPTMQKYIPLHLLPKKLIVHDPWNVLSVSCLETQGHFSWTNSPDVTYVYRLRLSPDGEARLQADRDKVAKERAEIQEKFGPNPQVVDGCVASPPGETVGHVEPFLTVIHPPVPQPEPAEEAHLYLTPARLAGEGNHSVVYRAEWEIPRSVLMPPTLCQQCVLDDVAAIVKEQDGEDGSRMDPKWKEKSVALKKVKVNVDHARNPLTDRTEEAGTDCYTLCPEGPVRSIATRIPWRSADEPSSTACPHTSIRNPHPPATKVRVIAKLSLANDTHLEAEATNYQAFPTHFFQHWNGYNVVPPIHEPTPVGAVVPQFYGFYEPEETHGKYLSPIMLLEDCGVPVDLKQLNIDDKNECASLYYRFHHAGWCHRSVAVRNILVQEGPLTVWPAFRDVVRMQQGRQLSFRLIDFGRSEEYVDRRQAAQEEMGVVNLFKPWDHLP